MSASLTYVSTAYIASRQVVAPSCKRGMGEEGEMGMSKQQSGRASTIFAVPRQWAGLIAVIGLTGLFGGCKGEEAAREDVVRPVKVAIVEAAPQGRTLSYAGVVRPRIESALGFRVASKIIERSVSVGDRIE